jgi:type IV pilus assembly protein PilM
MIQFRRTGNRLAAVASASRPLSEGQELAGAEPEVRRRLAATAVRDMLHAGSFRGRDVVSCLRADELAVKNVRLPQMSDQELAGAVGWECQERFGFEVTPDRVHFIRAGEIRQGSESRDEILLMAISEEQIRQHMAMLEAMRLRPLHIEAEPLALFRAYQRFLRRSRDESHVSVIVDIGLSGSKVVIARGSTPLFIKAVGINGRKLNESVAHELGLTYAEAAHFRRGLSGPAAEEDDGRPDSQIEWSVLDAIRGQVEEIAREVALCLRYCSVTFRGLRPSRVTLTGGEAYGPAVVKLLDEYLDYECEVGQPLKGIDLSQVTLAGDRRGVLTEWSVAAGLALRTLIDTEPERKGADAPSRLSA